MSGQGLVVDNSVVMAWFLEDEANDYATSVLDELESTIAYCPGIWPLEFANALLMAQRRKRITTAQRSRILRTVQHTNMRVEHQEPGRILSEVLLLASEHRLSTYDACYLDLALQKAIPIATQDKALRRAANKSGASVYALRRG